jgi:hypothetical protein
VVKSSINHKGHKMAAQNFVDGMCSVGNNSILHDPIAFGLTKRSGNTYIRPSANYEGLFSVIGIQEYAYVPTCLDYGVEEEDADNDADAEKDRLNVGTRDAQRDL